MTHEFSHQPIANAGMGAAAMAAHGTELRLASLSSMGMTAIGCSSVAPFTGTTRAGELAAAGS